MPDQVAFNALIKELNIKSLVSGDKAARLILEFIPTDDILDAINRLHRADHPVSVGIVAIPDNTEKNGHEISKRTRSKRR
ncbi:MAG: hypothetical protein WC554_11325 [Clostridia bacterium]|jgi:hypothetical protein